MKRIRKHVSILRRTATVHQAEHLDVGWDSQIIFCHVVGFAVFFSLFMFFFSFPRMLAADENYSFNLEEFEKKPFEWGGHVELKWEYMDLNQDGAFYLLEFSEEPRSALNRYSGTLQLEGSLSEENLSLNWLFQASALEDDVERQDSADIFELYASAKPTPLATLNLGKKAYKWGKGYAWNPAAVIDRPKDPYNPEEALEGFTGVEMDLIKSFSGSLQTAALTAVYLPVTENINDEFEDTGNNFALKLYLLYKDTDIDLIWFEGKSQPTRYGFDFAKNLASNFEIHGELVYTPQQQKRVVAADGSVDATEIVDTTYLLGIRYLTDNDITTIAEFYHNDDGYTQEEMEQFFQFVDDAVAEFEETGNEDPLVKAQQVAKSYGIPQAGRNYLYVKISQKEPFDLLYTTPGLTTIINLEDKSFTITPEITYTGFTNWEWRLRAASINGANNTEYGEKQSEARVEIRVRYFF